MDLKQAFTELEDEYLKFDRVDNKLHSRPDMCAFILLDKLCPAKGCDIVGSAEHDEIWLDVDCEKLAEVATKEDVLLLTRCGIMYDEEMGSLHVFV